MWRDLLAFTLLAAAQEPGPEVGDVTVAGRRYDVRSGAPLQIYRDDLVRGTAIVRGKVKRDGQAGQLAVQVSTDDGKTWQSATGVDEWSFSFKPTPGGRYVIRARVMSVLPPAVPDLQLRLEKLDLLDADGDVILPKEGRYPYAGPVKIRGQVLNAGAKPAAGLSVAWQLGGKQGVIAADLDLAPGESKALEAALPDLGGETATLDLIALRGKNPIGGRSFHFVPAKKKTASELYVTGLKLFAVDSKTGARTEVAKGAAGFPTQTEKKYWLEFDVGNSGSKPHFNVPLVGQSGAKAVFSGKVPLIPPGGKKKTGMEIDAAAVDGVLDILFGEGDEGGGVSEKFGGFTTPGLKTMKVRLSSVEFVVDPHFDYLKPGKSATLDKFWGQGRVVAPLGMLPPSPIAFMMESAPASVSKTNDIAGLAADWAMPMPGSGLPMVQYGNVSYRLQRMDLHMPTGMMAAGGGYVSLNGWFVHSKFGEFKCDLAVVRNLYDFHSGLPGQLFMFAKGNMAVDVEKVEVDFSPSWSPMTPPIGKMGAAGVLPPAWKGAMPSGGKATIQPAGIGFPSDAGTINAKAHFFLIDEAGVRGLVLIDSHVFSVGGFGVDVTGMGELEGDSFKPFRPAKAEVKLPGWLSGGPGLKLEDPANQIAGGKADLVHLKPPLELKRDVMGVSVKLPAQQYLADLSAVRGHPSLPPSWVGLFCEKADIAYKGQSATAAVQVLSGEWSGTAVFGGNDKVSGGVTIREGATLVKLVGPGNVEIVSDASGLLLPPGVTAIKQLKFEGPIGGQWLDAPSSSGDIPGPWTFAFGGVRVSIEKAKVTPEGLQLGDGWFLPPADVGGSWLASKGVLTLKGGGFGGELALAKFTWSPAGWTDLVVDAITSKVYFETNALKKIAAAGTAKLGSAVDAVPLSPQAAFLPTTPGHFAFYDKTKGPKIEMPGGVALEAGMDLELGSPSGWTGVLVKSGKLRAPPLLASASIPYGSLEFTSAGAQGDIAFTQAITSTPQSGVEFKISKGTLHLADGKLSGGKLDGTLSFPFNGTTLSPAVSDMKLDSNGSQFGLMAADVATGPAPFAYKGMQVSISMIDVDLSPISSLIGATSAPSWRGARIDSGTIQIKLAVPSKSGDPVAFSMEGTTFEFGGGLGGRFKVATPIDLELIDPKGFRLEITGGWVELSNGALVKQSLDGACALPSGYGGPNPRARFKAASISPAGDLYATGAQYLDANFGPYKFGSNSVTVDLSAAQSPSGKGATWKGLALTDARFSFGQFGEKLFYVDGQSMGVDAAGLSTKISVSTNQAGEYGGFDLAVKQVTFDIADSLISKGEVAADLKMPQPQWKGILKLAMTLDNGGVTSGKTSGSGVVEMPGLGLKAAPFFAALTTMGKTGWVEMAGFLSLSGRGLEIPAAPFTKLRVQHTGQARFDTGFLNLSTPVNGRFNGFPIAVERIEFGKDGSNPFANVGGKLEMSEVIPAKYVEARISATPAGSPGKAACDSMEISGSWSGVTFKGTVAFFDDPSKGRGFQGDLAIKVAHGMDISLDGKFLAAALADYRTWRIGANLALPSGSGIPLGSTGISIYGFRGGLAHNMKVNPADGSFAPEKGGWVFSAGATIGTADDGYTFNADATLSISSGPVFMIEGDFWMLCQRQARTDKIKGGVKIILGGGALKGDAWAHAQFHGIVEADGTLQFYFPTSGAWFIRLGTKEAPITAKVLNGPSGKGWIEIGSAKLVAGLQVDVINQSGSVGPLSGSIKLAFGGEIGIQPNPFQFSGEVWASGEVKGSVEVPALPDPSVSVGVEGYLKVSGPDPTTLKGGLWVGISICGVDIGGNFSVSKSW